MARAVAAVLVVLHHIAQYFGKCDLAFPSEAFAGLLIAFVAMIHIPVFMLVAGTVLGMSARPIRNVSDYGRFVYGKLLRLMLPYLSISALHLVIVAVVPGKGVGQIPAKLAGMVLSPMAGPAGHLWFLYCLMTIFLIWPVFAWFRSGAMRIVVWGSLVMLAVAPIPWPRTGSGASLFGVHQLVWFLPMFAGGCWFGDSLLGRQRHRPAMIVLAGCVCGSVLIGCVFVPWPAGFLWETALGAVKYAGHMAGGLCVLWSCGLIDSLGSRVRRRLSGLGLYSYDIYLLHVGLIGQPLVFALGKLHPGRGLAGVLFVAVVPLTVLATLGIGQLVRRVPCLAFLMLGVQPGDGRRRARPAGA